MITIERIESGYLICASEPMKKTACPSLAGALGHAYRFLNGRCHAPTVEVFDDFQKHEAFLQWEQGWDARGRAPAE